MQPIMKRERAQNWGSAVKVFCEIGRQKVNSLGGNTESKINEPEPQESESYGWDTEVYKVDAVGRLQSVVFHRRNGISIFDGFYDNDERHGVWTWYHNLNEVERKELYKHGRLQATVYYSNYKKRKIERIEKGGEPLDEKSPGAKELLKEIEKIEKQQTSLSFIEVFEARKDQEAEQIKKAQGSVNQESVVPQKQAEQKPLGDFGETQTPQNGQHS